ncbi:SET and MYND domain-containing protein 4-like [Copidosoma floridanum]|uniref:SET and MYND domain-containing protein 4-like n=1 Tax=Copidosoma floridanum TaxID=29053 RepID=UPI000C6FB615|nr:SET and MYND domain-containing protein 4-like [Copidosoma floridanum]
MDCSIRKDTLLAMKEGLLKKSAEASTTSRKRGNELLLSQGHNKGTHLEILSLYTQSVVLAESGSEELAMAYGNRSSLLLHLRKYDECLVDIDRACRISRSQELKLKLVTRKMKCMSLMDNKRSVVEESWPTSRDVGVKRIGSYAAGKLSKVIPCAYDCVTLVHNSEYGRHCVATKNIEPGQIIAIEKCVMLYPKRDKIYLICSHCLTFACNGIPCEHCTAVVFCSEKCREEAFIKYHDFECAVLPFLKLVDDKLQNMGSLLAAVRLFIKSVKKEGWHNISKDLNDLKSNSLEGFFDNGIFQSDKLKTVCNLFYKMDSDKDISTYTFRMSFIKDVLGILVNDTKMFGDEKSFTEVDFDLAADLIYKLKTIVDFNAFQFRGPNCLCMSSVECKVNCGEMNLGLLFSPFCSLLNHSCNYNTHRLFTENGQMFLYTVQPLKKGEQLFTSYGFPIMVEKTIRQNFLKDNYGFICHCRACTENWPSDLFYNAPPEEFVKSKLKSEFQRVGIKDSSYLVLFTSPSNISFNKSVRNDIIRIIKVIHNNFSGSEEYKHSFSAVYYIEEYFVRVFGIKIFDIPGIC